MLDIRYPIGGMFLTLGLILVAFGLVSDPKIYQVHSLGINVNLVWGCVLLIFGGFMTVMAQRARCRAKRSGSPPLSSQESEQKRSSTGRN